MSKHRRADSPSPAGSTPARTTGGTGAELQTSRIETAAGYRYAAQETKNIAEAKSLACRKAWRLAVVNSPHPFAFIEGNVSTARRLRRRAYLPF